MLDGLRKKRDLTKALGKAAADEDLPKLQEIVTQAEKDRAEHTKITDRTSASTSACAS